MDHGAKSDNLLIPTLIWRKKKNSSQRCILKISPWWIRFNLSKTRFTMFLFSIFCISFIISGPQHLGVTFLAILLSRDKKLSPLSVCQLFFDYVSTNDKTDKKTKNLKTCSDRLILNLPW